MGVQCSNELGSPVHREPQLSDALVSLFKPYILEKQCNTGGPTAVRGDLPAVPRTVQG